ncbi:perforin-1-like [Tiliqua scincoides]|uniref:perforin-1-like n=1 Tax=Tiliqua scincoides TaxID=71010 RepID=UPI0034629751
MADLVKLKQQRVSPQCRTATADECKKSQEFIPGHDLASRGFDITRLERSQYNVFDFSEWKNQDGSCTLCENPLLQGKPLQRLPLAFTDWKANISCQQKVQHSIYHSAIFVAKVMTEFAVKNDWKKELDMEVNPSANRQWAFAGSESKMTDFIKMKNTLDKYIFLLHHASCSYYKFRISKDKSVRKTFENNVQILPEKYEPSSKMKYHNLIETYGTHFITEVDLGARVSYLTARPVCLMVLNGYNISEISICLEIEVGIRIGFAEVTKSPDFQTCKKKKKDPSFYSLFIEQMRIIEGGERSIFKDFSYPEDSIEWLESVKSRPTLLSYSLEPLHTLFNGTDLRRESLRQAVSEYIRERTLWRNCTHSCPAGVQHSPWDTCSCECPNNNFTNSMCCSQQQGLATLTVTIESASSLWGDFITGSDSYVKVLFKDKLMCTHTVWNSDNPEWNANFDFGIIQIQEDFSKLELQVWDQDFGWDDDLLGKCFPSLIPWDSTHRECHLNHGRLYYNYHLACGPHLGGRFCRDYITVWPKGEK